MSRFLLRLILSYAAVAFTTIAVVGLGIFWAFLNRYNQEIDALEAKLVEHTADAIRARYIEPARRLYFRLTNDDLLRDELSFFVSSPVDGNRSRIVGVRYALAEEIEPHASALQAVAIHYRENRMSISSRGGVRFDVDSELYDSLVGDSAGSRADALAGVWRIDGETVEYVRQYPFSVNADTPALMTISIPFERFAATMGELSNEYRRMVILDDANEMITPEGWSDFAPPLVSHVLELQAEQSSRVVRHPTGTYVLTVRPIDGSNWRLAKLSPVEEFYERSRATRNVLLIVAVSGLSVCVVLSVLLARYQYQPVARIAQMVRGIVAGGETASDGGTDDEYDIDFARMVRGLTQLSSEVDGLRRSVAANRPVLRHHLVQSALLGTLKGEAEFTRRLSLIGVSRPVGAYQAVVVRLRRKQLATYELEERSALVYHLVEKVAEFQGNSVGLAGEVRDDEIGILVLADEASLADGGAIAARVSRQLTERFGVSHRIGIGSPQTQATSCRLSYRQAVGAVAAGFYLRRQVIAHPPTADGGEAAEIPAEHRHALTEALHDRDREHTQSVLDAIAADLSSGSYSTAACRQYLAATINDITAFADRVGYPIDPSDVKYAQNFEEEFADVGAALEWIYGVVTQVFDHVEESVRDARLTRIRDVQRFIQEHLADPLSLDWVADVFHITASTLSREFKLLYGKNFVDYVRESRLALAQELLRTTRQSIKVVGERCGYNSSSYFIQQFRRQFGVTPSRYRAEGSRREHGVESTL